VPAVVNFTRYTLKLKLLYVPGAAACYNPSMSKDESKENEACGGSDSAPASGEGESRRDEREAESEARADEDVLRPHEGKVGEAGDNLRGREQWFRQRTGSRK
jgi:hypothetical protein